MVSQKYAGISSTTDQICHIFVFQEKVADASGVLTPVAIRKYVQINGTQNMFHLFRATNYTDPREWVKSDVVWVNEGEIYWSARWNPQKGTDDGDIDVWLTLAK